ncbi:MAG: hypothetical protein GY711_20810 [bacterium]|nr:hypothetical protein [bacterium]
MDSRLIRSLLLALPIMTAGCGKHGHGAETSHEEGGAHLHEAPHGGALAVLSAEFANAEIVVRPSVGALDVYLFDGHVENSVRSSQESIALELSIGGETVAAEAQAVASTLSGETVGDTSHFSFEDDRLKGVKDFEGTIQRVQVLGQIFDQTRFSWPVNRYADEGKSASHEGH